MIHVIATIDIQPGKRAEFLELFKANVPNVLAEEGCVSYEPTVDVEADTGAQPPLRDNVVVVVEQWANLACLHAHLHKPHMATYREQVKDLVRHVELRVLRSA
ncbi:MAG TPA: putative quinol monooxygenase [Candidatus Hydrogenedentes bacterium]|jgi:quinol monooxygenase YgiN|nr:putative quinol monooxygenase [Candidatus Hydrogenedentota bacterium]HPJ98716.1 putative quinol monooxygenase [Candidatus Hydrogenedentota bacterium]